MTTTWTADQILALAPDTASVKSGKDLANKRKWVTLGRTETVFWGECQGSAKLPYQAQLDITSELGYKCNCPSRKLPCKHTLGLFLLFEKEATAFTQAEPPTWVEDWLKARQKRSEQQAKKREQPPGEVNDPAAQAKRIAERKAKAEAGVQDLRLWLNDVIRQGLAAMQGQSYNFWDRPAARLVDAQLPGLARQVRELAGVPASGAGWQGRLLERLAKLHLQLEGFKRLESLPETTQTDLRNLLGWSQNQDELLTKSGVTDTWAVLGQSIEDQERLKVRRTWLWGQTSGQPALLLHFTPSHQPFEVRIVPGTSLNVELIFYPGAFPLRAIIRQQSAAPSFQFGVNVSGQNSIEAALRHYGQALSTNPWLEEFPLLLSKVQPVQDGERWLIQDASGKVLPIMPNFDKNWQLMALSSNPSLTVFGQWDGNYFLPLSALSAKRFVNLASKVLPANNYALPGVPPWEAVLATALVGTDRQPCVLPPTSGQLGEVLSRLTSNEDTTEYLLGAAALLAPYGRAGQLPTSLPLAPAPPSFENEDNARKLCSETAIQHLQQMLAGTYDSLLGQWLEKVAETGQRVPEEMLPPLLELGRQKSNLQAGVLAVAGERGQWLASQNSQWSYSGSSAQTVLEESIWQTGTSAERRNFFRKLRAAQPDRARELLETGWKSEKADDRATFLDEFITGLTLADEPFLEAALDDRSKEVRSVAARVLSHLPQSAFLQRMQARVADSLYLITEKGKLKLEVNLPTECTKEMQRDGIESNPPQSQSEKTFWLSQMLELIPPGYWSAKLGRTPLELLEAAFNGDWFKNLLGWWQLTTLTYKDLAWAEALTVFSVNSLQTKNTIMPNSDLLELLPTERREMYARQALNAIGKLNYNHPAKPLLLACASPWSLELSREVVASLRDYIGTHPDRSEYMLTYLIREIAPHLNPAIASEISEGWPTEAPLWNYVTKSVDELIALLQFRQSMLAALL